MPSRAKTLHQWAEEVAETIGDPNVTALYHRARRTFLATGTVIYPHGHPRQGQAIPAWQERTSTPVLVEEERASEQLRRLLTTGEIDAETVELARGVLEAAGWTCTPPE